VKVKRARYQAIKTACGEREIHQVAKVRKEYLNILFVDERG